MNKLIYFNLFVCMNKLKFTSEGLGVMNWYLKQVWELLHPLLSWSSGNDSGKQIQSLAVQIPVSMR